MAFGTFDGLHPGHMHYLRRARQLGDFLIVVVARDRNVRLVKGKSPAKSEKERLKAVSELDFVDKAVLGDREMRKWGVIARHRPVVIALGYDQQPSIPSLRKGLGALSVNPRIVRIRAFKPAQYKSSKLPSPRLAF